MNGLSNLLRAVLLMERFVIGVHTANLRLDLFEIN